MTASVSRETLLVRAARPNAARSFGLAVGFSLLIAGGAHVSLHLTPVPATMQSFAVLLCGALLGSRWGACAVGMYLLEGAAGLPVFSEGHGGAAWLLAQPTAGFLWAFPLAAFATGWLCERGWDKTTGRAACAMLLGAVTYFAGGWLVLSRFLPANVAFQKGVLPFVLGDALKIAAAALLLPLGWKVTKSF